jgi:hypothetical protein
MQDRGFYTVEQVVERTFAWISHNRRMSKDHERLCSTGVAFGHAAMARLVVGRLARARGFADGLPTRSGERGLYATLATTFIGTPSSSHSPGYEM